MKQPLIRKQEVTANAWIKQYADANGERQIVIAITQNDKQIFEKTPYKVKHSEWTGIKHAWVSKKRPNYAKINSELTKLITKIETEYQKLEDEQGIVTKEQVFNSINKQFLKEDYLAYWDEVASGFDNWNQEKGYLTTKSKIIDYHGTKSLDFKQVNKEWLKGFEDYLRDNDLADESIAANLKRLRRVWNIAVEAGIVDKKYYPFGKGGFKIKQTNAYSEKTQRLTPEELNAVFMQQYQRYSVVWYVQKGFELAFNLCGIRIEDLLTLKQSYVKNGRITYNMKKGVTKSKQMSFLIDAEIQRILNELSTNEIKGDKYLLPFLPVGIEQKSSRVYKTEVGRKTALYNKYLKQIADDAGVSKTLTSHLARHSFAATMYDATKDLKFVQQNLGHKNINTTMGYIGVLSPAENDTRLLNAKSNIYNKQSTK